MVKDVAAAAVLVTALTAAAGGALVLGPVLLARLRLSTGWVVPAVLGALVLATAGGLCLRLSRAGSAWYNQAGSLPRTPEPGAGQFRREERF